jgi:hypothetical protein
MPASTKIQVVGVKNAINGLRKIDPELQKEFKSDAKTIAQPAIDAAKKAYEPLSNESHPYALSGMARSWVDPVTGRQLMKFKVNKAIAGVGMKFDTRKKAIGVILILQKDVATAIWETAGRKTTNRLGRSLGFVGDNETRIIKPAVEKHLPQVEQEMEKLVKRTMRVVQAGL